VRERRRRSEAPPEDRSTGAALRRRRPGRLSPEARAARVPGSMPRRKSATLHGRRFPRSLQERILSAVKRKGGQETLERMIERVYPSRDGYVEVRAHRAFARALPAGLIRRAMPARVHRGVLYVNAESPAWAQELQMMAPRVLEAM